MSDQAQRLEALEERCAWLEKQLHELSDVVYRQTRELEMTLALATHLRDKMSGDPGLVDHGPQDKPPHY
jgi:uncharacterized coiled-coil protein SlyX